MRQNNDRKAQLVEKAIKEVVMKSPILWADLIINALEWHMYSVFTVDELRECFFDADDSRSHSNKKPLNGC